MVESEGALPGQPWEQQPGEPERWYGRFQIFLSLGPARTVLRACRQWRNQPDAQSAGSWNGNSVRWRWRERAHAWDAWQRQLMALSERNLRLGLRHSRIGVTEESLEVIRAALDRAEIADVDRDQAREWLPQLRVFLRDMLVVQRQEFEHDFTRDDPAYAVAITADDLRAANRALEERGALDEPLQTLLIPAPSRRQEDRCSRTFLVCARADSELLLDLPALRAVQAATGLRYQRLLDATRRNLGEVLRRQRGLGQPIEYIHMALPASAAGLELADGSVDCNWLSERLGGVRVLLLASCESDSIGDCLGVVPYVVTLSDCIPNQDAAALTQHFWHGIGLGKEPGEALDEALTHCSPAVGEYVVRHW